jgi:hypothetical protein
MTVQVEKQCASCSRVLPINKFKRRSSKGRQAGTRQSRCNRCLYVLYQRPSDQRKTKVIADYKISKGCADCGFNAHPSALDFDHLPGSEKSFDIGSNVANRRMEVIWEEIAKCEVVCRNCHAIRTDERRVLVQIEGAS